MQLGRGAGPIAVLTAQAAARPVDLDPRRCVFINCPFDKAFQPLFDALVFVTICCGFVPRSSIESSSVATPRLERILEALTGSQYSIHDLSRCRGEGTDGFARFNLPLELGIAMAARHLSQPGVEHDWSVLVPEGHSHAQFISDLAGIDPRRHDQTPERVIRAIMPWLVTRPDAETAATPKVVIDAYPQFVAAKQQLEVQWSEDVPWSLLLEAARRCAPCDPQLD